MDKPIRVRYAPSPTGHLHIGNARTALFNYLFAKRNQGKFIIRIEDTDLKRNIAGGEESQLTFLRWLGIEWDEGPDMGGDFGPYRQTERLDIYKQYWQAMLDSGSAYRCYCTEAELEQEREEQIARNEMPQYSGKHRDLTEEQCKAFEDQGRVPSIRLRVPTDREYKFQDMVKGEVSFQSGGSGDFVIVKKDGIPTYNFAVVIDDYLMQISHVLRGDDHISNTPRQLMIYEALGWEPPVFGHMTLIVNEHHKKLSKRDESIVQFIEQYAELGYLPGTLFNFISLLGWSPEGEEEIFTRDELIEQFDASRLSKSPAVFDTDKLSWMNNQYLKKAELSEVVDLALIHLQKSGWVAQDPDAKTMQWVTDLVSLHVDKLRYAAEIVIFAEMFFKESLEYDAQAKEVLAEAHVQIVLQSFLRQVESADPLSSEQVKMLLKNVQTETGFKGKALFMSVRAALTGQVHGPDLNQTIYLLGKDKVMARVKGLLV